jgi:hypothetical protein
MKRSYLFWCVLLLVLVASSDRVWAGAAAILPGEREVLLPYICKGGPDKGEPCTVQFINGQVVTNDCPKGKCVIEFLSGPGTMFDATVTVIADDITPPQPPLNTRATLIAEVKKNGETHILTEVTQISVGTTAFGHPMGEEIGIFLPPAPTEGILTSLFLLESPTSTLVQELRDLFDVMGTGTPVVVDVKPRPILQTPHSGNGDPLGSAVRFKVKMRFVNQ